MTREGTRAAYLFVPDGAGGWDGTKVTAADGGPADWFGHSVALLDGHAVVAHQERVGPGYVSVIPFD